MTDPDVDAAGVAATLDRAHRDGTLLDATSIEIGNRDAAYAVQRGLDREGCVDLRGLPHRRRCRRGRRPRLAPRLKRRRRDHSGL